jgi:hypothetical protein
MKKKSKAVKKPLQKSSKVARRVKSIHQGSTTAIFAKRSLLPKNLKDTIINRSSREKAAAKSKSKFFKEDDAIDRLRDMFRGGIDGMAKTHARLSVANLNSPFAMPIMGSQMPIEGSKKGLSVQASLDVKGNANITGTLPFFHTPGNAQDAYNLPKSYVEQIRWSRLMYNLNPYIHSITDLKAFYPYSKFKLTTPEPWVTQFMEGVAFNKKFNLYRLILRASLSLKKFGEALFWGIMKQDGVWPQTGQPRYVWSNFILLEPELVEIKKPIIGDDDEPKYYMRPNRDMEELVRKIKNNDPEVKHLVDSISPDVMEKIEKRQLVPLDPSTISSIQYITDGSAPRGTPPYQSLFVNFIFEDFVRLALMAQANRYHFPIELWLLGDLASNRMPSVSDLEVLRDMVTQAIQNPPFTIFFPPILDYKAVGVSGSLIDIKSDMEYAHRQYLIGMGVNENLIVGDSGVFSNSESAGNQAFIRMMIKDRDEMEEWMRWHFFEPLAEKNNLKINKNGILVPIIPEIEWEKTLDFKAEEDAKERDKYLFENQLLDPETFISSFANRNPEDIKIKITKAIGGVFDDGKLGGVYRKNLEKGKVSTAPEDEGPAGPGGPMEAPGGGGGGGAGGGASALAPEAGPPEANEESPEASASGGGAEGGEAGGAAPEPTTGEQP